MNRFIAFLLLLSTNLEAASGGPDAHGYTWVDSDSGVPFVWIDTLPSAITVLSGNALNAGNVELAVPWGGIYGDLVHEIRISRNGYITNLLTANGNDETNDCPLPKTPSVGAGGFRIYPLHDDLELHNTTGRIYYQYFAESPHPIHRCGVHVITWHDSHHEGSTDTKTFTFQALLFDNLDVLFQYGPGNPEIGVGSTTGIQNADASIGLSIYCNEKEIPDDFAILIQPPVLKVNTEGDELDSPAGSDISLREAMRDSVDGGRIEFASSVDRHTILLASVDGGIGSVLSANGKSLAIDASSLTEGVYVSSSLTGGHLAIINGGWVSLDNVNFEQASASGSTYLANSSGLVACHCRWLGNRDPSENEGGAISLRTSIGAVKNAAGFYHCDFIGNRADLRGGAISAKGGSKLRAEKCKFWRNKVGTNGRGGALYLIDATVDLRECDLAMNIGTIGGALYVADNVDLNCTRCTFDDNRANTGGAVIFRGSGDSSSGFFRYCTFFGNCASDRGGAIAESLFSPALDLDAWHCTFYKNVASSGGGAFSLEDATCHAAAIIMADNGDDQLHISNGGTLDGTFGDNLETGSEAKFDTMGGESNITAGLTDLGHHGGYVRTCMLLQESDAIDRALSGGSGPLALDARGLPTFRNGDGVAGPEHDCGAVEIGPSVDVFVGSDSGVGSLQTALNSVEDGGVVQVVTSRTIELNSNGISVPAGKTVFVQGHKLGSYIHNITTNLNHGQSLTLHNFEITADLPSGGITSTAGAQFTTHHCGFTGHVTDAEPLLDLRGDTSLLNTSFYELLARDSSEGLFINGKTATLIARDCQFEGNGPDEDDAFDLLRIQGAYASVQRCSFVENEVSAPSSRGAGVIHAITNAGVSIPIETTSTRLWLLVEHSTLSGNTVLPGASSSTTGAIVVQVTSRSGITRQFALTEFLGNTLVDNHTLSSGSAALRLLGSATQKIRLEAEITRNIIAENTTNASTNGEITSGGHNLSDTSASFFGVDDIIDFPLLGPLVLGPNATLVHVPRPGSVCIDGGGTDLVPTSGCLDGRGFHRSVDGDGNGSAQIDIGAVESGRVLTVTTAADENGGLGSGTGDSLRECLLASGTGGVNISFDPALHDTTLSLSSSTASPLRPSTQGLADIDGLGSGITLTRSGSNALLDASDSILTLSHCSLEALRVTNSSNARLTYAKCRINTTYDEISGNSVSMLRNCNVTGDPPAFLGLLLTSDNSERHLRHCTLRDIADSGAAVLRVDDRSKLRMKNVTVARNGVNPLTLLDSTAFFSQCTFTRNHGGFALSDVALARRPVILRDCLIANNSSSISGNARLYSQGGNHLDFANSNFSAGMGDVINRAGYLAPLADYNGDGLTEMRPLAASASFDTDTGATPPPNEVLMVTTDADENDSPAGLQISLREAFRDIADGGTIIFAPSLNNKTFHMGSSMTIPRSLTIDATALPLGIDLTTRLSWIDSSLRVAMHAVHVRDTTNTFTGGAISGTGTFTASHCAFSNNVGTNTGAIRLSGGKLVLENVTFSENSGSNASALAIAGTDAEVAFCTFGQGSGANVIDGGVSGLGSLPSLQLYACVFFDNVLSNGTTPADSVSNSANLTSLGYNMFPDTPSGADTTDTTALTSLGSIFMEFKDYGFGTAWVPSYETLPQVGAPIDFLPSSGNAPPPEHDARGLTRPARMSPDAGAHEWASELEDADMDSLPDWWELSQGLNSLVADDTSVDSDGDGASLLDEFIWRTDPNDAASFFTIDLMTTALGADITFNTEAGYPYRLETSTNALSYTPAQSFTGDGSPITLSRESNDVRRFWRVRFDW